MRGSLQFRWSCTCRGGVGLVFGNVLRPMEPPAENACLAVKARVYVLDGLLSRKICRTCKVLWSVPQKIASNHSMTLDLNASCANFGARSHPGNPDLNPPPYTG